MAICDGQPPPQGTGDPIPGVVNDLACAQEKGSEKSCPEL